MKKIFLFLMTSFLVLYASPKFLQPEEAFVPHAKIQNDMKIVAGVSIAKDIYLYDETMKLELVNSEGISIKNIDGPTPVEHHEEMTYLSSPEFVVTLQNDVAQNGMKDIELKISYQGCSEKGLCYEPYTKNYKFSVDTAKLSTKGETKELKSLTPAPAQELSQTDEIAQTIATDSIFLVILTFLGFGLILALTPCTFPMIPIISGLIISHGDNMSTKKAFYLSVVYVLAMAVAYTIAGVLAGLFGSNLQAALQTPWVIYSFSAIFVLLSLSMFGFYELKLPDSFVAKVSSSGSKATGVWGVAIMGFLSALIVGPCVAAPLAGALVYIGQTGDALLGGAALFAMSIGMGIPLIVVGVGAGKFMPKPGAWMTMVSAIFGVMMLGVAIWMLDRVVDTYVTMMLSAMLGLGFALYLGAFDRQGHIFKRASAFIILLYSIALFIGGLAGSTNMLKPLEFLKSNSVVSSGATLSESALKFDTVTSVEALDGLLEKYKGKRIMLDFRADWCVACKELEETTFKDPRVLAKLEEFVIIRADVTQNTDKQKALSKKYGVFGPPVLLFFDEEAKVIQSKTIVGYVKADEFLTHLSL